MDTKDIKVGDLIWAQGKTNRQLLYVENVREDRFRALTVEGGNRHYKFSDFISIEKATIAEIQNNEDISKIFYGRLVYKAINDKLNGILHQMGYVMDTVREGYILKPRFLVGKMAPGEHQRVMELREKYSIGYREVNSETYTIGVYRVHKRIASVDYRVDPKVAIFISVPNRVVQKSLLESIADKFSLEEFEEGRNMVEYYYEEEEVHEEAKVENEKEEEVVKERIEILKFMEYFEAERVKINKILSEMGDRLLELERKIMK